jgi:hypothetical protein
MDKKGLLVIGVILTLIFAASFSASIAELVGYQYSVDDSTVTCQRFKNEKDCHSICTCYWCANGILGMCMSGDELDYCRGTLSFDSSVGSCLVTKSQIFNNFRILTYVWIGAFVSIFFVIFKYFRTPDEIYVMPIKDDIELK